MAQTLRSSAFTTWLADPLQPTVGTHTHPSVRLTARSLWTLPALFAVALLAVSAVGWAVAPAEFYFAYLVGWLFCLSISLGALFFVLIQHIVKAHWSVVVRRVAESLAMSFPMLLLLSIPIFFGMHDVFHWTHEELYDPTNYKYDPILVGKQAYLNTPFFIARVIGYLLVWSYLSYSLYKLSVGQDVAEGDTSIPARQRKLSAWGIPVFGLTIAFAAFDLLMSLEPHWYSTIFGVYFFSGAFWAGLACITLTTIVLQKRGLLNGMVGDGHYHDLGRWMFGFTVFWAYIAYSQYSLIWYANLAETTIFYRMRLENGWEYHSHLLYILHFIVPFFLLLPRATKRMVPILAIMSVWFFVMHWFDLHWIAMPVRDQWFQTGSGFHWVDLTVWFGLFALFLSAFFFRLGRHAIVPVNDPRLGKSIQHST